MEEVVICSYSTLAGARKKRREIGGCIIRILADPDDIFVVVPSFLQTRIMSVDEDGKCDGSISLVDLTSRAADAELATLREQNAFLREALEPFAEISDDAEFSASPSQNDRDDFFVAQIGGYEVGKLRLADFVRARNTLAQVRQ